MDRPTNQAWDCDEQEPTQITDRYLKYLDIFTRVLEEEEAATTGHEERELSRLVRWSMQSGSMWFHMLLSANFSGTCTFPFTKLIEHVGEEEWNKLRDEADEADVVAFGKKKKRQL